MKWTSAKDLGVGFERRRFLAYFSGLGLAGTLLPGTLWAQVSAGRASKVTVEMVEAAARIAGLEFDEEERQALAKGLNSLSRNFKAIRDIPLENSVAPALRFEPLLPGMTAPDGPSYCRLGHGPVRDVPADLDALAFWTVADLSRAIKAGKLSPVALTKMYLARLKRFGPVLECVVTLTEERALKQAAEAEAEIASGHYRGPLHGIPWGAKDLLAAKGYPTTWGAMPFKDQHFDEDATVVERLDRAGAILVAKLSLGALAQGDVWFGGRTNCPWDLKRGSSGSSAGPGAATAAGLVGFAIGSETNGSITSPSTVNGVTGLRPTFGRVSRYGAMALSWSMDKLGPMCRSAEDCALVLSAIMGADGKDGSAIDAPFAWDATVDLSTLRIGYVEKAFQRGTKDKSFHQRTLASIRGLGIDLIPVEFPDFPAAAMMYILTVEAAATFDDLTRSNRDDELVRQGGWPRIFRQARFVPAVEYIRAQRARTVLMEAMARVMDEVDVIVTPTNYQLPLGNFTGHPLVAVPSGFRDGNRPTSVTFFGRLYGESAILSVAKAFQDGTDYHLQYPPMDDWGV